MPTHIFQSEFHFRAQIYRGMKRWLPSTQSFNSLLVLFCLPAASQHQSMPELFPSSVYNPDFPYPSNPRFPCLTLHPSLLSTLHPSTLYLFISTLNPHLFITHCFPSSLLHFSHLGTPLSTICNKPVEI